MTKNSPPAIEFPPRRENCDIFVSTAIENVETRSEEDESVSVDIFLRSGGVGFLRVRDHLGRTTLRSSGKDGIFFHRPLTITLSNSHPDLLVELIAVLECWRDENRSVRLMVGSGASLGCLCSAGDVIPFPRELLVDGPA